ncbi:PREDICTED: aminoacyl tRNA synthase complex-interacting multifunctional protein 2-like isoform X2 [Vollenhovia emeryi]|uniref:aminoacyl tRNA synthase complex-interacting multifunctional protein 2-like isoform X2 n=1 Tax=Vollenhovia emeryi TaxID=411798 RepID=UPI0005F57BC8|nr:PREDICTED: aminoacyl tRNA synthase complex-interacting multifunctional protein 2-like isoform X2 [Vollenhovia emeryi]
MEATSTGMYSLRPVVVLPSGKCHSRPVSMYELRNIHYAPAAAAAADTADTTTDDDAPDDIATQASLPEYGALEARQEKILGQLAELKKQVSRLCHFLKQSNQMEVAKDVAVQKPVSIKLVINVNPRKPPYSILALQKLWKDTSFRVISYLHSTTSGPIPIVFPQTTGCTANVLELTLIWKDVPNLQVITTSCQIGGEVNFLRYVSRLIESHCYESTCLQPHTLDFALDYTNLLHHEQRIEKGLRELADKFEEWSCKGGFNIVDIAVWSLIKQYPGTKVPQTLRKWYDLCEEAFTGET